MENSTPLTRCDTCHTVFEVPSAILDSVDSRVRCGECLQVFDASINLHTANRPDFSLVDETLVDGASESAASESPDSQDADSDAVSGIAQAKEAATASEAQSKAKAGRAAALESTEPAAAVAAREADRPSDGIVSGRIQGSGGAQHDDTADESHLEATMSDFDLFSDDASLPEVSYEFGENTVEAIRLQFDSVGDVVDETLSDSLFPNDVTIDASGLDVGGSVEAALNSESVDSESVEPDLDEVIKRSVKTDFVVEETPKPETVEFDYSKEAGAAEENAAVDTATSVAATQAAIATTASNNPGNPVDAPENVNPLLADAAISERRPSRFGLRLLQGSLLLLTLVLVAALYGYRERNKLVDNPLTRPFYAAWCNIKGCPVPARFDKSQLKVVEKNIFSHPTLDDALVITVLLENNADFEQRYPALFLWLSDSARRTVASNEFEPDVYLPENGLTAESVLAPGQQRRISIDVRDPGRRAVSLELSLR